MEVVDVGEWYRDRSGQAVVVGLLFFFSSGYLGHDRPKNHEEVFASLWSFFSSQNLCESLKGARCSHDRIPTPVHPPLLVSLTSLSPFSVSWVCVRS